MPQDHAETDVVVARTHDPEKHDFLAGYRGIGPFEGWGRFWHRAAPRRAAKSRMDGVHGATPKPGIGERRSDARFIAVRARSTVRAERLTRTMVAAHV